MLYKSKLNVGDTVKWYCDDLGKVVESRIESITIEEVWGEGLNVTYKTTLHEEGRGDALAYFWDEDIRKADPDQLLYDKCVWCRAGVTLYGDKAQIEAIIGGSDDVFTEVIKAGHFDFEGSAQIYGYEAEDYNRKNNTSFDTKKDVLLEYK